jgi:hypothetical protein
VSYVDRAEVEGSTIPEAVPVEGVVPEAEVATEAATEPVEITAAGVAEEVCSDALPATNGDNTTTNMNAEEEEEEEVIVSSTTKMILNLSIFLRRDRPKNFIGPGFNLSNVDIYKK